MNDNELKYQVNISFVLFNFLEDLFLQIKSNPKIIHEFKQNINQTLGLLRKFNKLAEQTLTDEVLESFDKDKEVLKLLIQAELIAHTEDKQTEFLQYIKDFFEK
jgi:hypothetical protein